MTTMSPLASGLPRVNLLPRSEVAKRERESVTRRWLWGVLGAIVIALLIIAGALTLKLLADQRLVAEQTKSEQLLSELASLAEVSQALTTERELTSYRAEAMGSDLAWGPVVGLVESTLPEGAILTGFDFVSGGIPLTDDAASEIGLTGTVSVASADPIDIVAAARTMREAPGVLFADGVSVTSSSIAEGNFAYVLTVTFDQSIYSGEYSIEEGED